jgi:hypothetical protein
MRIFWLVSVSLVVAAGAYVRARRRNNRAVLLPDQAVSSDWLAHARGHEEQEW